MPTYDYHCDACEHDFEEFQSFSDPVLTKCPKCGKKKLRRLFGTGAGVIFKGSGFYETDYRSDSYKQSAKAEQDAGSGAKTEGDSKKATAGTTDKAGKTGGETTATTTTKAKEGGKSSKSASKVSDD